MSGTRITFGAITLVLLWGLVLTPVSSSVAKRPISLTVPEMARDTPPSGAAQQRAVPSDRRATQGGKVSRQEYEGWRQYSVNCARCHGQDALPNPVAANLLVSLGPGGPVDSPEKYGEIVMRGRPARGMPSFKGVLSPVQNEAIYAYLKGRADKRIPAGRPATPSS
jgi:mono/diheme cytochrome c family protein